MGETNIEWTGTRLLDGRIRPGYTFNPWVGCTKIAPECDFCYASDWAARAGRDVWGADKDRQRTTDAYWKHPYRWNAIAEQDGIRLKVFCASLADIGDNHKSIKSQWRYDLWSMIKSTPMLDWLLLTKRPENVPKYLPEDWGNGWPNVWLGTTTGNQKRFDHCKTHLVSIPARVHFLSMEPLLGPVQCDLEDIEWVIAGGESGAKARPSHPDWFRSIREQCRAAGVPFFFKQWGEWAPGENCDAPVTRTERTATWWSDQWDFGTLTKRESEELHLDDEPDLYRIGKRRAGNMLDGVQHIVWPKLTDSMAS